MQLSPAYFLDEDWKSSSWLWSFGFPELDVRNSTMRGVYGKAPAVQTYFTAFLHAGNCIWCHTDYIMTFDALPLGRSSSRLWNVTETRLPVTICSILTDQQPIY